jgi:hypothetical protein
MSVYHRPRHGPAFRGESTLILAGKWHLTIGNIARQSPHRVATYPMMGFAPRSRLYVAARRLIHFPWALDIVVVTTVLYSTAPLYDKKLINSLALVKIYMITSPIPPKRSLTQY